MAKREFKTGQINADTFSETFIKNYTKNREEFQEETESLLIIPEKRLSLIIS